eukprot:CAMPEP_0170457966 /NCGR_PEP_ID=MMETSP0123-20130129/5077_1 /TAXON_ID=182087 /ORGANISM="Favella ehrenbergii, Strain Fehren 1" /LENGTH=41 /DNA_ID= /DNA_START= /DNA_END= /DNA_ORIENTATION=
MTKQTVQKARTIREQIPMATSSAPPMLSSASPELFFAPDVV